MLNLTIRKIGNSYGVILPQEALAMMNVKEGDTLTLTGTPDGYRINTMTADAEFRRQMAIAEEGMRRYRNALKELAK